MESNLFNTVDSISILGFLHTLKRSFNNFSIHEGAAIYLSTYFISWREVQGRTCCTELKETTNLMIHMPKDPYYCNPTKKLSTICSPLNDNFHNQAWYYYTQHQNSRLDNWNVSQLDRKFDRIFYTNEDRRQSKKDKDVQNNRNSKNRGDRSTTLQHRF